MVSGNAYASAGANACESLEACACSWLIFFEIMITKQSTWYIGLSQSSADRREMLLVARCDVTPKGVPLPAMCKAGATHAGL